MRDVGFRAWVQFWWFPIFVGLVCLIPFFVGSSIVLFRYYDAKETREIMGNVILPMPEKKPCPCCKLHDAQLHIIIEDEVCFVECCTCTHRGPSVRIGPYPLKNHDQLKQAIEEWNKQ